MRNFVELLIFVGMPLGFVLALAPIIAALSWPVEAVLRRRIGVYFGYVVMFAVAYLIARFAQSEIMECGFGGNCSELSSPNCDCGFSLLFKLLIIFLAFVTMPLLLVSQMKLKKWSQSRRE
jgi:hypothetical protein